MWCGFLLAIPTVTAILQLGMVQTLRRRRLDLNVATSRTAKHDRKYAKYSGGGSNGVL